MATTAKRKAPASKRKTVASKPRARKKAAAETPKAVQADADDTKGYTVEELRDLLRDFDPSNFIRQLKARRLLSHHYAETPYLITSTGMPDPWTVIALMAKFDVDILCERDGADLADAVCRLRGFVLTGYISRKVQFGYANILLSHMWQYREEKLSSHFREAIARELCRLFHASRPPDLCGDEDGYEHFIVS